VSFKQDVYRKVMKEFAPHGLAFSFDKRPDKKKRRN
jgi:hypothetical protein